MGKHSRQGYYCRCTANGVFKKLARNVTILTAQVPTNCHRCAGIAPEGRVSTTQNKVSTGHSESWWTQLQHHKSERWINTIKGSEHAVKFVVEYLVLQCPQLLTLSTNVEIVAKLRAPSRNV